MYDEKYAPCAWSASISSPRRMKPNTTHCTASLLSRKEEIIAAVQTVNFGALPQRFMGKKP